jgi:hypothetical protein
MRRTRELAAAMAVTLAIALGGCSWLLVRPPPPAVPPGAKPSCSESYAAPVVDAVFAVAYAIAAIEGGLITLSTLEGESEEDEIFTFVGGAVFVVAAGLAILHERSSSWGSRHVDRCRSLRHPRRRTDCGPSNLIFECQTSLP